MTSGRREALVQLGLTVLAPAPLIWATRQLPDDGPLRILGAILATIAVLIALSLPFAVWQVVAPEAATAWMVHPTRPVPLVVPIEFWALAGAGAWMANGIQQSGSYDPGIVAFLWCLVAGTAAFAALFSRMYLQDRRLGRATTSE